MNPRKIDLHVHSTFSDGSFTPAELVQEALQKGLSAMALTDHDTTAGVPEAIAAAKSTELEIIPGVELSTKYKEKEIHVVGIYIDTNHQQLAESMKAFRECRDHRNEQMLQKLRDEGFDITMEGLVRENPKAVITRANIAKYLVDHGQIASFNQVFDKYIGNSCKCFVPRKMITPMEACQLICAAGGIPILAHPILYHMNLTPLNELIHEMKTCGLVGIEAIYSTYTPGEEALIRRVAAENHLELSGGSDFHGANKPFIQLGIGRGNLFIPYELLTKLKRDGVFHC